jgi:hypothetical protein
MPHVDLGRERARASARTAPTRARTLRRGFASLPARYGGVLSVGHETLLSELCIVIRGRLEMREFEPSVFELQSDARTEAIKILSGRQRGASGRRPARCSSAEILENVVAGVSIAAALHSLRSNRGAA